MNLNKQTVNIDREKNRAYSWGRAKGWPNPMTAAVPKTWNRETFKQYKVLYAKYSARK